jgi:hypothetical protein
MEARTRNKKQQKLMEPGMRLIFVILLVCCSRDFVLRQRLALAEGAVIFLLLIYSIVSARAAPPVIQGIYRVRHL